MAKNSATYADICPQLVSGVYIGSGQGASLALSILEYGTLNNVNVFVELKRFLPAGAAVSNCHGGQYD
jgi:hypothetical protein